MTSKVIIDTNLWINFLIRKDFSELDTLIEKKIIKLIFSSELIDEFLEVSQREKFQKFFKISDVEKTLFYINRIATIIEVTSKVDICRDFKDNYLLSLAVDADADFIITLDKDLLVLKTFHSTQIVTWHEFIKKFTNA